MNKEIKEIKWPGQILDYVDTKEHLVELFNYITNLQKQNKQLVKDILNQDKKIDKAIEILKLCNSKCAKETIDILRGENNE